MINIIRFKLPGLWNSEYPLVVGRVIDIAGNHNPDALRLGGSYTRLAAFRPQLAKIEAQERSDRHSARLSELDQERDTLFNVIREIARCFGRVSLVPHHTAAAAITTVLQKHGNNMASANYTSETKRLYDLVADIERSPATLDALAVLSLQPLYERLKTANREFDELFMQRSQQQASVEKADVRTIRMECDKAVTAFWAAIEYCMAEHGEAAYTRMVNELNNLNGYYKQQLTARAARRKAGKEVSKEEPITDHTIE